MPCVSAKLVDESFWETFKEKLLAKGADEASTVPVRQALAARRMLTVDTFCYCVFSETFTFKPEACILAR